MSEAIREWCPNCEAERHVRYSTGELGPCMNCSGLGYTEREIPSAQLAEIGRLEVARRTTVATDEWLANIQDLNAAIEAYLARDLEGGEMEARDGE